MLAVPNPLQSTATARPEHPVLITDDGVFTAAELAQVVARRAAWLAAAGVGAGHRVALMGPPTADWILSMHALAWLGAAVLPVAARLPVAELQRCIEAGAPDWVLPTRALGDADRALLADFVNDILLAEAPAEVALPARPERFWPLEEVRLVMLTSGTTAVPRAVPLTTAQLLFSAMGAGVRLGHAVDDTWLACLPLSHVGGLSIFFRAAWFATTVVLHPRFDAIRVARALDAGEVSLVSLVPSMLEKVLAVRPAQPFPSRVRAILLGGAPAAPELLARCRELAAPVSLTWGMTETASQVAACEPGDLTGQGDCGPPQPFARVDGRSGVLTVRGPVVAAPLITGDRGFVDQRGHVHVEGRRDDVILSGGENIAPEEVEAVLMAHPAVADAAVVGVPNQRWGQRPVAVLVGQPAMVRPQDEEMDAWCRERLASFKVPERYIWVRELPRDALGKLRRKSLLAALDVASGAALGGLGHGPPRLSIAPRSGDDGRLGDMQAAAGETGTELGRNGMGPHGLGGDEGMDEADIRPQDAIGAHDAIGERGRGLTQALDIDVDIEHVAEAHRRAVVGVAVHQGHEPITARKARLERPENRPQELFEGGMTVLVKASEEDDAGPVHLVEADGDAMLKSHMAPPGDDDLRGLDSTQAGCFRKRVWSKE